MEESVVCGRHSVGEEPLARRTFIAKGINTIRFPFSRPLWVFGEHFTT